MAVWSPCGFGAVVAPAGAGGNVGRSGGGVEAAEAEGEEACADDVDCRELGVGFELRGWGFVKRGSPWRSGREGSSVLGRDLPQASQCV